MSRNPLTPTRSARLSVHNHVEPRPDERLIFGDDDADAHVPTTGLIESTGSRARMRNPPPSRGPVSSIRQEQAAAPSGEVTDNGGDPATITGVVNVNWATDSAAPLTRLTNGQAVVSDAFAKDAHLAN